MFVPLLTFLATEEAPVEIDPERATPGLWGFIFFVGLGLATVVLIRFMNRSLRNIDPDLPEDAESTGFGRRE